MAVDQSSGAFAPDDPQLTSVRVPLDQAADAFVSPDASGRTPIVVLTSRQNRIGNVPMLMGVVILVGGILWGLLAGNFLLISAAVVLGLVFFVLAIFRSFLVRIPEGTNGLLQQRGKYLSTIESGTRVLPPWIVVSHLVTRRIIPFDVPAQEARQLAMLQQVEQMEQQALTQRKQTDAETLGRQAVIARVDREHEELQLQIQQAEARRRVVELEAEAEELRLAKLQDRLRMYPQAAEWEWQGEQLEVARGLASNTHAVVQLGSSGANDIARAFLLRDVTQGKDAQANTYTPTPTP